MYITAAFRLLSAQKPFGLSPTPHPTPAMLQRTESVLINPRQEVQLELLAACLINAAFILPRRGNMGAVQGDRWYLMVLISLSFLKGKFLIWLEMFGF